MKRNKGHSVHLLRSVNNKYIFITCVARTDRNCGKGDGTQKEGTHIE